MSALNETARRAGQAARAAFLARIPEPADLDFPCPACRMPATVLCHASRGSIPLSTRHAQRMDRVNRARQQHQAQASAADDAAYNIAIYRAEGHDAGEIARRLAKSQAEAYLMARGWTQKAKAWTFPGGRTVPLRGQALVVELQRERSW